jgi:tape measure domain-containing protein
LASTFQVGLEFSAKTQQLDQVVSKIQKFERDLAKLKGSDPFQGVEDSARAAGNEAERAGRKIKGSFSGAVGAISQLAGAYLTARAAQSAFATGIERIESGRRLTALAGAFGEVEAAQNAAARAAQRFGIGQTEANASFAQIYARLRPIGTSLKDIETAYNGFNTAAKLAGTNASEASSAWMQLSQALGSGVLRGEELNSVFEQTPGIVQAIAKEMGAPIGQIRQLAQDGKITSDIVIRALRRIETEGANQLAEALNGPAQKIKNFQVAFENTQVAVTETMVPELTRSLEELSKLIVNLEGPIRFIGGLAANTFGTINDLIDAATKPKAYAAGQAIRGGRLPMGPLGGVDGAQELFKGTSGSGGVGLTGLMKEAKELAALRKQPMTTVLLELMKNRLKGMDAKNAPAPAALPALTGSTTPGTAALTGGTTKVAGAAAGSVARAAAGPKLPAYIDKEVLRKWLISQGMGRTSGDFTNAGHRTPNHMLNAMDMGFTSSKYDSNYVQKTKEMEAKLRATGAFGNQLFGPTRDPKGHKDHLHIPTPGGKVKMNSALGSLMGMSGSGQEGQYELAQGLAELEAQRAEEIARSLESGVQMTTELGRQIELQGAGTEAARQRLEIQYQFQDRQQKIDELMDAGQKKELTALNNKIKTAETQKLENELLVEKAQLLEGALRPIADENELLEARLAGTEKELIARREIAALTNAGMAPDAAKALVAQNQKLKAADNDPVTQLVRQWNTELNDTRGMIASLGGTIQGELGSAMSSAITGVIQGTTTVKEAFSTMFKNIGAAFIDMATQMIAKALIMKVLGIFGGAMGGGGGSIFGGGAGLSSGFTGTGSAVGGWSFAGGGYTGDAPRSGGVDGQGGFPAILHPQETVVDHARLRSGMGGGGESGGASPITLNVTATKIGDSDFVKVGDLQAAMRQTRKEAAADGEKRALSKLQNSPRTRAQLLR